MAFLYLPGCPAEVCLLAQQIERLLTRKLPLKLYTPAAEFDPKQSATLKRHRLQGGLGLARCGDRSLEDIHLQRIEQLETLLQADKKRKPKFQKPEKQRQWQEELDKLWQQLD